MSDNSLYQQALIQHHKNPMGFELAINASVQASGSNLACGDEIIVEIKLEDNLITEAAFHGDSCAICRASASMLCQKVNKKTVEQAMNLIDIVSSTFAIDISTDQHNVFCEDKILAPLLAVKNFPVRIQCAILPWTTLATVLKKSVKET